MSRSDNQASPTDKNKGWPLLLADIADSFTRNREHGLPKKQDGELVVLGSGLSVIDFTADVQLHVESADYVFYCLYDCLAETNLLALRPDALDLFIFYQNEVPRDITYLQMAEAMLFPVRKGLKVVSLFYGHPGLFATPTHRAVKIARQEGYKAVMRPGISALDYLIADVGFDPSLPGLLSYEASDMLLRSRVIDTSLHVVLWQVGVVGDFDFDSSGYKNDGFGLLVDELVRVYGEDWQVVHYIAPTYQGVEATIERFRIGDLKDNNVRSRIMPISTFYIEPKLYSATNEAMALALGLISTEQAVPPPRRSYENLNYGPWEIAALMQIRDVETPKKTVPPVNGPVAEFMRTINADTGLLKQYVENPEAVLADSRFAGLSARSKRLLSMRHDKATRAAILEELAGKS